MKRFDRSSSDVGQDILAAPFLDDGWDKALKALARHTRSGRGELVAFGDDNSVPFNWITDLSAEAHQEFLDIDGGRPDKNVRLAASKMPFEVAFERDYDEARTRIDSAVYDDYARKHDMMNGCQSVLANQNGLLIGLAVLRSEADGRTTEEDRAAFADLSPYVLTAVRLQRAVKHQGAQLMAGAFEAMNAAAFILDAARFVQAQTSAAIALLRDDRRLSLAAGRLTALPAEDDRKLQVAIRHAIEALENGLPGNSRLVLGGAKGPLDALYLEIFALPKQEWALGFEPRVLIVAKKPAIPDDTHRERLAAALGLTAAEADVALLAARGLSREQIAIQRGTSADTVSTQLKSLFRKSDVNREAELVARLNQLLL